MIPPFRVYLFDVDGTLLDSASDICGAVREALGAEGVTDLDEAYLRSFVGFHLFDLFEQVLPANTREQNEALLARYRKIYLERKHRTTRIYDGVPEMLSSLGGLKATATTKSSDTARAILTQFGLVSHFNHVQGTDGFPSKPEPNVIFKSLELFGVEPEECLLIGDASPDMEAGRRAGVRTCGVTWGYGDQAAMRSHTPDYWVSHPKELVS
ncbi:HAD family hydrolase [Paludibaculum fermentans]|uniref:HAD family hydrolase n=1 Tax=Paludibaculum fermentans TaxID=1473598 RepID=UPI003EBB1BF9